MKHGPKCRISAVILLLLLLIMLLLLVHSTINTSTVQGRNVKFPIHDFFKSLKMMILSLVLNDQLQSAEMDNWQFEAWELNFDTYNRKECIHCCLPGQMGRGHPHQHSSPCCSRGWASACTPRSWSSSSPLCPAPRHNTPGPDWYMPHWTRHPGEHWVQCLQQLW